MALDVKEKKITNFRCCSIYGKEFTIKDVVWLNGSFNGNYIRNSNRKNI